MLFDADFRGASTPWIDPLKEIKAEVEAVSAGFKSRSQVIRERGYNPQHVMEQVKLEKEEEEKNGLKFSTSVGVEDEKDDEGGDENKKEIEKNEKDDEEKEEKKDTKKMR